MPMYSTPKANVLNQSYIFPEVIGKNLPNWVISQTPEEFVSKMRQLLEKPELDSKISSWIDQVFGVNSNLSRVNDEIVVIMNIKTRT